MPPFVASREALWFLRNSVEETALETAPIEKLKTEINNRFEPDGP